MVQNALGSGTEYVGQTRFSIFLPSKQMSRIAKGEKMEKKLKKLLEDTQKINDEEQRRRRGVP